MTEFALVYDSFLGKVTDDMYAQLEFTELDTYRMLFDLLSSAIHSFEFPRHSLEYVCEEFVDERTYCGVESNYVDVTALIYGGGYFIEDLTNEEINIIAVYMMKEWFTQQEATVENTRMKYSGSDFKFTSQANHMKTILTLKKDAEREGFHLQRLYSRRKKDANGRTVSTFGSIMGG